MTEETVRPEDLKPGDRVKVTRDVTVVYRNDERVIIRGDGEKFERSLFSDELSTATITRLAPPVDPDLLLARKVVADWGRGLGEEDLSWIGPLKQGDRDECVEIRLALAAIKATKEQS